MTPLPPQTALTDLLQSLASTSGTRPPITPTHIHLLAQSLLPTSPKSDRSLAYICLTKIVEDTTSLASSGRDTYLAGVLQPLIEPFLNTDSTTDTYLPPTYFLAALFPLSPAVSSGLLLAPLSAEEDAPDPLAILLEMAELESPLQLALAELFVGATGTKQGREMVQSRAMEWLAGASRIGNGGVAGVCSAALAKLRNIAGGTEGDAESDPAELCNTMIKSLANSLNSPSATLAIVEGLSVLSLRPKTKQLLADRTDFLQLLFRLLPTRTRGGSLPIHPGKTTSDQGTYEPVDTSLCYGISTILVNISSRKSILSAEDEQMAKLRRMAEKGQAGSAMGESSEPDVLDETPAVQERVGKLYKAGIVSALAGLVRAESGLVRQMTGRLCLNLVQDKERRMEFIRDGGYKVLAEITRKLLAVYEGRTESSSKSTIMVPTPTTEIDILPTLQSVAKLIITTPPNLLFPPPHLTTSLNALTPLYTLLTHPSSSLLQTFEALMALTNFASISPDIADRIVEAPVTLPRKDEMWRTSSIDDTGKIRIIGKVEEMLMEANELVRRAATELVCNLAGSEKGFGYLSGEIGGQGNGEVRVQQRLKILMILTDVDDLSTRLAAGGALAILTESQSACRAILTPSAPHIPSSSSEESSSTATRSAWKRMTSLLEPEEIEEGGERIKVISTKGPEGGMVLRAGCILLNLLGYAAGMKGDAKDKEVGRVKEAGVERALKSVLGYSGAGQGGEEWRGVIEECLGKVKGL